MEDAGLPTSELTVFFASLVVNTRDGHHPLRPARWPKVVQRADRPGRGGGRGGREGQGGRGTTSISTGCVLVLLLSAFVAVAVMTVILDKNIGFVAITAAVALSFMGPKRYQEDTVRQIAWPTVLLVAGVSCYATILNEAGWPRVRRRLGRRPRRRGHRRLGALLRRRRGLRVRQLYRAAAGDHPDRRAAGRGRGRQRSALRGGPRGLEHDRRRQPVLDQRCADAGEPAGLDQ